MKDNESDDIVGIKNIETKQEYTKAGITKLPKGQGKGTGRAWMNKQSTYELYEFHTEPISCIYPNGIDQDSCCVGDAKSIIMWLLKHDASMKGYHLV